MAKGSAFERKVCRLLTDWWLGTTGEDVIFWRTAGSGGRATTRTRKGKRTTRAHAGDIAAIDPRGEPLTSLITFELKVGYPRANLHALLDKPAGAGQQVYEEWIGQARDSSKAAGTKYWAVIHQRDRRVPLAVVPFALVREVVPNFDELGLCFARVCGHDADVAVFTLAGWFSVFNPRAVGAVGAAGGRGESPRRGVESESCCVHDRQAQDG